MNLRYITFYVGLISLAFIGLICIQIYWIRNSIELRSNEFDNNVQQAMQSVAKRLDREEGLRQMNSRRYSLSQQNLMIGGMSFDETLFAEEDERDFSERPVEVPVVIPDDIKTDESQVVDLLGEDAQTQIEILEQGDFFEDLFSGGQLSIQITQPIEERVNLVYVDSLMQEELHNEGIFLDYSIGVFSRDSSITLVHQHAQPHKVELYNSKYRAPLFPWDIGNDTFYLKVFFPKREGFVLSSLWFMLAASALLIIFMVVAFSYSISTIFRQKKVSEIKNDFINNMTHELKTPISTISLACEALTDPAMSAMPAQRETFVGMINQENKRLGLLVENVLRSAMLDREDMKLNMTQVNLHQIIEGVAASLAIKIQKREGKLELDLRAQRAEIEGDEVHLTNVVYNMIDNAIKYSAEKPAVMVRSKDTKNGISLSFEDQGVGISKQNQERIFEKFYRVPKGDVHDVKGFGLGLSYVKSIVERHNGSIRVQSELRNGTKFAVNLPYEHEKEE